MYDDMVTTIVKDRPLSIAQAKEIIDTGLITAKQAKELGLIDRVAYPDTLRDELAKTYDAEPLVYREELRQERGRYRFLRPDGLLQTHAGHDGRRIVVRRNRKGKKIAVVYAVGPIMTGKSESGLFGGEVDGLDHDRRSTPRSERR